MERKYRKIKVFEVLQKSQNIGSEPEFVIK